MHARCNIIVSVTDCVEFKKSVHFSDGRIELLWEFDAGAYEGDDLSLQGFVRYFRRVWR